MTALVLEAADGLRLTRDPAGAMRVAWGEPDWLGPIGLALRGEDIAPSANETGLGEGQDDLGTWRGIGLDWDHLELPIAASVRAYAEKPLFVFRLEALDDLEGLDTGRLARPSVAWWLRPGERLEGGVPGGTRGYGHQYTEFAFPTLSDASLASFLLFPHRPRVMMPLWLNAPDGRSILLAPLDAFHDQVISVPWNPERAAEGVRCGWHGDLESVPRGFATELAVWAGPGPRRVLEAWGSALRDRHGTQRPSRYEDASVGTLSYWTDNGAVYWYRTEPGQGVPETLEAVKRELDAQDVPIGAFQLDSWFYPHELTKPVNPTGQEHVPPTGLLLWEPRSDLLPDGIEALRERLGNPPLITHSRHFSSKSPYFERTPAWFDGDRAHPEDPTFFEGMLDRAAGWGVVTFEQDWLVEMFLGVRALRARPGRARDWQVAVDRAAAQRGMSLQWCMATPADFFETLSLSRVSSIRTSGDYRYLSDNPSHWVRFLYTNALARALGLHPFKDVFLSNPEGEGIDGDCYAEVEAMLAALSAGPVGIGDRLGRTHRGIVLRTCREDGVLVKPDLPLAAIERCLRRDCYFEPEPLIGETWSEHPAGRWVYVAAFNSWRGKRPLEIDLPLADLGDAAPDGPVLAYDWRTGAFERIAPEGRLDFKLAHGDWRFIVLCPVLNAGMALFGDVSRYACLGDRRLRDVRIAEGAIELEVLGRAGESLEVRGYAPRAVAVENIAPGEAPTAQRAFVDARGVFSIPVSVGPEGSRRLRIAPA